MFQKDAINRSVAVIFENIPAEECSVKADGNAWAWAVDTLALFDGEVGSKSACYLFKEEMHPSVYIQNKIRYTTCRKHAVVEEIDPLEVVQCERKEVSDCDLCSTPWLFVVGDGSSNSTADEQERSQATPLTHTTKALTHVIANARGIAFAEGSRDGELSAMRDFDRRVQSTNYHSGVYVDQFDPTQKGNDQHGDTVGNNGDDEDANEDEEGGGNNVAEDGGREVKTVIASADAINQINEAASFNAWFHRVVASQERLCFLQTYFRDFVAKVSEKDDQRSGSSGSSGRNTASNSTGSTAVRGIMMLESANVNAIDWLLKTFPCAQVVIDDRASSSSRRAELWTFHRKRQNRDRTYVVSSTAFDALVPTHVPTRPDERHGSRSNTAIPGEILSNILEWVKGNNASARDRRNYGDGNGGANATAAQRSNGSKADVRQPVPRGPRSPVTAERRSESVFDTRLSDAVAGSCNACEDDWVIMVGTGRSGSTTVLEMLNSIPGVLINGEHNGQLWALLSALNHATRGQYGVESVDFVSVFGNYSNMAPDIDLIRARNHIQSVREMQGVEDRGKVDAELKSYTERFLCYVRWYFRHMLSVDCTEGGYRGFKEVRYATPALLAFLRDLFPCAKFILNYRDPVGQSHSSWWVRHLREDPEGTMQELNGMVNTLFDFHAQHKVDTEGAGGRAERPNIGTSNSTTAIVDFEHGFGAPTKNTFLLPMESFSVDTFNRMLKWLGKTECTFNQVLHSNWHSGMHMDLRKVIECKP